MEYFGYLLLSLAILLIMVLIHEAGHYTAAKILGFTVEEFSVGFGPKIFSRVRKNGEKFSLRALPLGGYCAFLGENEDEAPNDAPPCAAENTASETEANAESTADDLFSDIIEQDLKPVVSESAVPQNASGAIPFYKQKPWKRIIVLLGGVTFNFISAIIFSLIYIWAVGCAVPTVETVYNDTDGNPYCDFRTGDIIIAANGEEISVMNGYSDISAGFKSGENITFKVIRDGKIAEVIAKRKTIATLDADGKPYTYEGFGFTSAQTFINADAGNAFKYCVPYTFKLSWSILGSFGDLITGKIPITSVSGPVGSVKLIADVSRADWRNILILLPLLASNLAMFNLLPFPALDGAQIVFTVIEWIRKKPINRKIQGIINAVGLIVLLLFVLTVDILSFVL